MEFRFKQFSVSNFRSAMKVNTDGVLLGAAATLRSSCKRVLDIGTGTGTVALMLAQRLSGTADDFKITGIDIDGPSASEAADNFGKSPWCGNLEAVETDLKDFQSSEKYDLIVSNPPYFDNSLVCKDPGRNAARHCESLSYREIAEFAKGHLAPDGSLSIIIDSKEEKPLRRYLAMCGLFPSRILRIRTVPRKDPSRIIAEFSFARSPEIREDTLAIRNSEGDYTQEYVSLTKDFYLFF